MDTARIESEHGFTLIEIFTVVVIVGILAAIAIPRFLEHRNSAWRSTLQSDLANAALHVHAAAADNGEFPLALPPGIATSPHVSIVVGAGASTTRVCLEGQHAALGETHYYDSDAGGLTTAAC